MEWVIGIGGVFFRAKDPKALALWYHDHLGIDSWYRDEQGIDTAVDGEKVWQQQRGSTPSASKSLSSIKPWWNLTSGNKEHRFWPLPRNSRVSVGSRPLGPSSPM